MRNKSIFVSRLIYSIFITIFLINIFINNSNIITKIIIIPFLICSFATLGKNIFLIIGNSKYIKLFNRISIIGFLLFWFGFLFLWCYTCLKDKTFSMLLFSIPFWIIGIFLIKQYFFKPQKTFHTSQIKSKYNFKIITSSFLVITCLLVGIVLLFFGIKNTYKLNKLTKNYTTTNGYFNEYSVYSSDEDGTTYKLIYTYTVDDKEYTISTDYGTNYIPNKGSIRTIKYDPNNPEEAIIVGTNGKNSLIFIGGFFTFGALTFILGALSILGYFDKFKIDIVGTYIGFLFLIIGIGIILLQTGTTLSIIEAIKSFGLWILIPIMFVVVGGFQLIKCLFFAHNKTKNLPRKKV